ncbi:hypothetical protein CDAR_320871 [Caerostris darwini]|uniref:Uncharacterized protein n=1 Tax=Caerostris darwini TaxID=1538125 RepID=A0AAV4X127_9ARAC|nr:hypothetical protein CDAR_320871 [Caerostris darwini]
MFRFAGCVKGNNVWRRPVHQTKAIMLEMSKTILSSTQFSNWITDPQCHIISQLKLFGCHRGSLLVSYNTPLSSIFYGIFYWLFHVTPDLHFNNIILGSMKQSFILIFFLLIWIRIFDVCFPVGLFDKLSSNLSC